MFGSNLCHISQLYIFMSQQQFCSNALAVPIFSKPILATTSNTFVQ